MKRGDRPVTCTEHPDQELIHAYSNWAPTDRRDALMRCPLPDGDHEPMPDPYNRRYERRTNRRCANCGGPIRTVRAYSAVFCGGTCRVQAHRKMKRESRDPAVPVT